MADPAKIWQFWPNFDKFQHFPTYPPPLFFQKNNFSPKKFLFYFFERKSFIKSHLYLVTTDSLEKKCKIKNFEKFFLALWNCKNLLKNGLCLDILFGMADLAEKNYGRLHLTSLHRHLKWFWNRVSSHGESRFWTQIVVKNLVKATFLLLPPKTFEFLTTILDNYYLACVVKKKFYNTFLVRCMRIDLTGNGY